MSSNSDRGALSSLIYKVHIIILQGSVFQLRKKAFIYQNKPTPPLQKSTLNLKRKVILSWTAQLGR